MSIPSGSSSNPKPIAKPMGKPKQGGRLPKDVSDFLDKELNRLYDMLKTTEVPETREWAMTKISGIHNMVLSFATSAGQELSEVIDHVEAVAAVTATNTISPSNGTSDGDGATSVDHAQSTELFSEST